MKKTLIFIITYFLIIHLIFPGLYYFFNGFVPIYTDSTNQSGLIKSFFLIITPLVITIFIIYLYPKKPEILPNINGRPITFLFYFSILLKLAIILTTGGFTSAINGENNGTFYNYVSLFFDPFTLLLVLLFVQKKRSNIILAILFYILTVTISGSRSGIISVFFIFFIGFTFTVFKNYKSKLNFFLKCGIFFTPILFVYATKLRGFDDILSFDFIINQIVGRMSVLETSMLPINHYDNNLNLEAFYDKYSVWNQIKLSLDSILPGQIFDFDVMPNNYYRSFFLGYSQSFVLENYMSMNLTLPIYFYMKYSYFSIFLTVFYILIYYKILLYLKKYPLFVIVLLSVFYNLIYFFDWVMIFTRIYIGFLTIATLKLFVILVDTIKLHINIRKNEI